MAALNSFFSTQQEILSSSVLSILVRSNVRSFASVPQRSILRLHPGLSRVSIFTPYWCAQSPSHWDKFQLCKTDKGFISMLVCQSRDLCGSRRQAQRSLAPRFSVGCAFPTKCPASLRDGAAMLANQHLFSRVARHSLEIGIRVWSRRDVATMAHTYATNFVHCIFSTKERRPLIPPDRMSGLYSYFGGSRRAKASA
jgi:hypothetical protein